MFAVLLHFDIFLGYNQGIWFALRPADGVQGDIFRIVWQLLHLNKTRVDNFHTLPLLELVEIFQVGSVYNVLTLFVLGTSLQDTEYTQLCSNL